MKSAFAQRAIEHWTAERLQKLTAGKKLLILPSQEPELLRVMGLLNRDGSMPADAVRKYLQINHMLNLLTPHLDDLCARHDLVRILDVGCGNSFLTLLVAWYLHIRKQAKAQILGLDHNPKLIKASAERAERLGLATILRFAVGSVRGFDWPQVYAASFAQSMDLKARPHLVVALHACDTASDDALALSVRLQADYFAVAPCCQAELAQQWSQSRDPNHPLAPVFAAPNIRRETAAHLTDMLRMLLMRRHGYEVTATEFVDSQHTAKNRLLLGIRRGRFWHEAGDQFVRLKVAVNNPTISLETLLATDSNG